VVDIWTLSLAAAGRGARRALAHRARAAILSRYLDCDAAAIELVTTPAGKPLLAGDDLQFSLTHSGPLAMLAVSLELPVGIDLDEPRRPSPGRHGIDLTRGIRDRCSKREGDYVRAAADPLDAWTRLWVRKEAVVKASGDGLADQLAAIDVLDERVSAAAAALTGEWRCIDLASPQTGYHAALAYAQAGGPIAVRRRLRAGVDAELMALGVN
jgi:phosphopantetheinyl transferase